MTATQQAAPTVQPRDLTGQAFAFFGTFSFWPSYHPGSPADVARRLGATVSEKVDESVTCLVLGDRRGPGRAEAKKKAEKLRAQAEKAKKKGQSLPCPEIIDEAAYREMVRTDVRGKSFAFFGGFECCGGGLEETLLAKMVEAVGGVTAKKVDENLDYLVLGPRRGQGKLPAQHKAAELQAAGGKLQTLDETGFRELVRTEAPADTGKASTDFASFVSRLYGTVDEGKLNRALKMLKEESFKLYVHLRDDRLVGVVRSQTGSGTVYAPWMTPAGHYGCSTPELTDCWGLQGTPCKHLLVLLVGLARTGGMETTAAYNWIHATQGKRPRTDTELAAETYLQYKAAQAGEIDWRPTETVPEDFYSY